MRIIAPLWRRLPNRVNWWLLGRLHQRMLVSVAGIVTDAAGHVLLLRHRFWNGRAWGLPSGYARRGEAPEAALAREVREETGLEISSVTLVQVRALPAWIEILYRAHALPGTPQPDGREILAVAFFAPSNIPATIPARYRGFIAEAANDDVCHP
jgi:8-oxo-dGTP diphosphatase